MHRIILRNTALSVSRIGLGTGTSGFTGEIIQASMGVRELAEILLYGFDKGINFWDTAYTYGTYRHMAAALAQVKREEVVICSKFSSVVYRNVKREIEETLKELRTDHIDIGLVHGIRSSFELRVRDGALRALIEAKQKGSIRYVGLSSHGLGALEAAIENQAIELVYGRLNHLGAYMDSWQEDIISRLVAIPFTKVAARALIPRRFLHSISAQIEPSKVDIKTMKTAEGLFKKLNDYGKSVVAVKVIGAGTISDKEDSVRESLSYVLANDSISSAVIGITSKEEIDRLLKHYNEFCGSRLK